VAPNGTGRHSVNQERHPALQSADAAVAAVSPSWADVLRAREAEVAAQREYESQVGSMLESAAPWDKELVNPFLLRRRVAHEALVRAYRLWNDSQTRHNGSGRVTHAGRAHQTV
ncbi:MAG TPA: hypothetical protein VFU71_18995, partial [Burkholderiaceae bacterium]|nr:hypothetical protein [Burkholderiaceae bacterium]